MARRRQRRELQDGEEKSAVSDHFRAKSGVFIGSDAVNGLIRAISVK